MWMPPALFMVSGPGGSQIWLVDPSGNLVELFQSLR
jgi:hypothetical protein